MIKKEDKIEAVALIKEACEAGARKHLAAEILGLSLRTVQRWENVGFTDQRKGSRACPANKLSKDEKSKIVEVLNSEEFEDKSPNQIVPTLADQGVYIGSESTMYRILKEQEMNKHRLSSKSKSHKVPESYTAKAPNEVWSWDITYLPTLIKGVFFYLYMVIDIYSRKIVSFQVYECEKGEYATEVITDASYTENITPDDKLILHSDNGGPMKAYTMLAKLESLGIMPSFSRPRVSNDNPYSESLFKTMKYRPEYPEKPFENLAESRKWTEEFVNWYNNIHLHSGINFVTPVDRHNGKDVEILEKRHQVYIEAKNRNPERWSGSTRNWDTVKEVSLNKRNTKEISCQ